MSDSFQTEIVPQTQEDLAGEADWQADYVALTETAGMARLDGFGLVELTGSDRAAFLNRLCTNKVDRLAPGAGCEAFLTDAKAHVLAYVWAFVRPQSLVLSTAGGQAARVVAHLEHYLVSENVEIRDRSHDQTTVLLAGPRIPEILAPWIRMPIPEKPMAGSDVRIAEADGWLQVLQTSEPPTFLLVAARTDMERVEQALRESGVRPCGAQSVEAFRIEAGWPLYDKDLTEENLPQEVARDRQTLSFVKGCYLGQETVARIDSRGHVHRTLVGLKFTSVDVPPPGAELSIGGQPAGKVTSAAFSPRLGAALALGYVRRGHNTPGTRLDSPHGPVEVVAMPVARN